MKNSSLKSMLVLFVLIVLIAWAIFSVIQKDNSVSYSISYIFIIGITIAGICIVLEIILSKFFPKSQITKFWKKITELIIGGL